MQTAPAERSSRPARRAQCGWRSLRPKRNPAASTTSAPTGTRSVHRPPRDAGDQGDLGKRAARAPVSSIKGQIGDLGPASGQSGVIATALAIERGIIPCTLNWESRDADCDLDYVPHPRGRRCAARRLQLVRLHGTEREPGAAKSGVRLDGRHTARGDHGAPGPRSRRSASASSGTGTPSSRAAPAWAGSRTSAHPATRRGSRGRSRSSTPAGSSGTAGTSTTSARTAASPSPPRALSPTRTRASAAALSLSGSASTSAAGGDPSFLWLAQHRGSARGRRRGLHPALPLPQRGDAESAAGHRVRAEQAGLPYRESVQRAGPNSGCLTACAASAPGARRAACAHRARRRRADVRGGAHSMIHPMGVAGVQPPQRHLHAQRRPREGEPPVRPGARRLRDRRGVGGAHPRGGRPRRAARGADLRGALGYGCSSDAYRITDIHPDGRGAAQAMRNALNDARVAPDEVGYINAHGTSTQINDRVETLAIKKVFGERSRAVPVSSTKSMMGHLIAAAGAVEAAVCLLAIGRGSSPHHQPGVPGPGVRSRPHVPNRARGRGWRSPSRTRSVSGGRASLPLALQGVGTAMRWLEIDGVR